MWGWSERTLGLSRSPDPPHTENLSKCPALEPGDQQAWVRMSLLPLSAADFGQFHPGDRYFFLLDAVRITHANAHKVLGMEPGV